MNIEGLKRVYFIGIGGIGMSAIARYFISRGVVVSGYDRTATTLAKQLEEEGMLIVVGVAAPVVWRASDPIASRA